MRSVWRIMQQGWIVLAAVGVLTGVAGARPSSDQANRSAALQQKLQRIQQLVPAWQRQGGNPSQIGPLGQQLDGYLKAGSLLQAEATADQLLRIVSAASTLVTIGTPTPIRLSLIPASAELVFPRDGFIFTADRAGGHRTQLTFEHPRAWEHVAVSIDYRYVAGKASTPQGGGQRSTLWVFDLQRGIEAQLVPSFVGAGDGGVDWDEQGFVYFAGTRNIGELPDVYKIKPDGTALTRVTATDDRGEVDVSVLGHWVVYIQATLRRVKEQPEVRNEVWMARTDGTDAHAVWRSERFGRPGKAGPADPELSPEGTRLVFSDENPSAAPTPPFDTAHDLWVINVDGTDLRRLTKPGSISIIPDWLDENTIIFTEVTGGRPEQRFSGVSMVNAQAIDQTPQRVQAGINFAKTILRAP